LKKIRTGIAFFKLMSEDIHKLTKNYTERATPAFEAAAMSSLRGG
jgi:hypothetical protein